MDSFSVLWGHEVSSFRERVEPFLREHEAANNLPLGLLAGLDHVSPAPLMAAVLRGPVLQLAALKTGPAYNLVLSTAHTLLAGEVLAEALYEQRVALPGVIGPTDVAAAFTKTWTQQTSGSAQIAVQERIYQLTAVVPGPASDGICRWAAEDDADWLTEWVADFIREAMPEGSPSEAGDLVTRKLQRGFPQGGYRVIERSGEPVSIAGYGGPTGHGIRVGPVYTPPAWRGRGYASALVGDLSQKLLDAGYRVVFLFTDLTNPTSNAIYQRIGYRPIIDVDQYHFSG